MGRADLFRGGVHGAFETGVGLARFGENGDVGAVTRRTEGDGQADPPAAAGHEDGAP